MVVENGLAILDVFKLVAHLNQTLIVEVCVIRCSNKNGHHRFILYLK